MVEIIGVRFKSGGKQYYFDPNGTQFQEGQGVIVETARGLEYAIVVDPVKEVEREEIGSPLKPIVRIATEKDLETVRKNEERRGEAMKICKEKIRKHELEMKLIDAEYAFDGTKLPVSYTHLRAHET